MSAAPEPTTANGADADFEQSQDGAKLETATGIALDADDANDPWLKGPPVLDRTALYGLGGEFVDLVLPETEAHAAALLLDFLVMFTSLVGRTRCLIPDGLIHTVALFLLVVGKSGKGRKGTAYEVNRMFFEKVDPDFMEKNVRSGLSSGEGVIDLVRDAIMKREPVKSHGEIADYRDVEAEPAIKDKRILLREGEFSNVMRAIEREGNKLTAVLRDAYDGKSLATLVRHSPLRATDPHICLSADVTSRELLRDCDAVNVSNGFLNRFVYCFSHRSKILPRGGHFDDQALAKLATKVRDVLETVKSIEQFEFSQDAWKLWDEGGLYRALTRNRRGLLDEMMARAEAHTARFAFIFAMLDGSPLVLRPHLKAAAALWDFCESTIAHTFGDKIGDRTADAILTALRETPGGMTRSDISGLFSRNVSREEINEALDKLRAAHLADKVGKGSHTAERWYEAKKETRH